MVEVRGRKRSREKKEARRRRRGSGDDLFYDRSQRRGIRVGDVMTVKIGEVSRLGEGVVRLGGVMIRIPGSKMGDRVKIRIEAVQGRSAEATILESPS
ncbi:MAG: TRAM domain-containing protein [Candidatus Geothermarchaeales archaeon]